MDISRVFSDYRHEWAAGDFNDRFVKPPYYDQFVGHEPVFLLGGRGTGKTVTLRSLNFRNSHDHHIQTGIYVKAFKNRVEAFSVANIDPSTKIRAFEHYINLLCCFELSELCLKLLTRIGGGGPIASAITLAGTHFGVKDTRGDPSKLRDRLRRQIAELSAFINDPSSQAQPRLSHGEVPVVDLARDVCDAVGHHGPIYICIDEWENLSADQQQALNRWIKNCERPITYKIGVREGGIRTTNTGGSTDPLHCPADYIETRIAGPTMKSFCRDVVEHRLKRLHNTDKSIPDTLTKLLESLDRQVEAVRLGAPTVVDNKVEREESVDQTGVGWLRALPPGDAYLAFFQAERMGTTVSDIASKAIEDPHHWTNVKNNYGHLSLFSITRGLKGSSRQKYYAGAQTYLELSGGNVRYLLELLDEAVLEQSCETDRQTSSEQRYRISAEVQTVAATNVARRRLRQIEVLSDRGLEVLRLVVALGTAFAVLVREPGRRAPEQTSFTVRGDRQDVDYVVDLLNEGCSILAFIRDTTTKRTSAMEPKDDEYRIHPILTPHFCIPYRRKRKVGIDATALKSALQGQDAARSLVRKIVGILEAETSQDTLF